MTQGMKIILDYSKQPSWELGIASYLILTNIHPFLNYPKIDQLDFNDQLLKELNISHQVIQKISELLEKDTNTRIDITQFCY